MNTDLKAQLLDLKARQEAGEQMPCPRCGMDKMKPNLHTNALSREFDIYVCDACGTNEGMLAFMRNPLPLNEWACFAPNRPESDLETLTVPAATRQLRQKQIPYLCGVFEKWLDDKTGTDFRVYQHEAYENCPGLQELWPDPFRAVFATSHARIHVRFKRVGGQVIVAVDSTKR